ncbi:hypothetical protein GCM10027432_13250 [Lysobacter fragariae]
MILRARTVAIATMLALVPMLSGCDGVRDIGEEMGWIEQPASPPPPPPPPTLADRWIAAGNDVGGVTQSEWTQRWWQWVGRFPSINDVPYRDPDGRRCAQFQEADGPVWFLAGTDGQFETARSCTIPAGKHLFVPMINWFAAQGSCEANQVEASRFADHIITALVILDGRQIGDYKQMRLSSGGCFTPSAGKPAGATAGYWLMLSPLPAGSHTLAISAAYRDGGKELLQNFRYELTVEAGNAAPAQ